MKARLQRLRYYLTRASRLRAEQAPPTRPTLRPAPHGLPDWASLLGNDAAAWQAARQAAHGPHVLVATSAGGFGPGTILESTLAVALTLRGARVHILLCDEALPACLMAESHGLSADVLVNEGIRQQLCKTCFTPGHLSFEALGLPLHLYSKFITAKEQARAKQLAADIPAAEISGYRLGELAVGEHALAGALRYFASGNLSAEPLAEPVLRCYFEAALLTIYVIQRLLKAYPFESICFNHGLYVPHGLIGEVARQKKVPVVNWDLAYRKQCFIFSHGDTYHHTMLTEPTSYWQDLPWDETLETQILAYLKSRWYGTQDWWIRFHEAPREELATIAAETGINFSKPCIGLLTNVMWDAQLIYPANAFPNMLDWTFRTIDYFAGRPDLQLIIRIHPGEIRASLRSRQPMLAEIRRAYPQLPSNIFVIPPESHVSTYAAMSQCNAVIIYGTKTGVELASMGIPVIVAGEAWIRNKGLTLDATSPENYFGLLDKLPLAGRLSAALTQQARRYAYHFFFRRMIPLEMMEPASGWPPFQLKLNGLDDLRKGRSGGLDVICDGILKGAPFIYRAEDYSADTIPLPGSQPPPATPTAI